MPKDTPSKLKIEHVAPSTLAPFAANSRLHSDAQVAQIAASIKEFGFTNPVLVDADGGVIAGHGRLAAALRLELAELPIIRLGHLSDAQRRAYVIADNKIALNASWDLELLVSELKGIEGEGLDLALTGFAEGELAELMLPSTSDKDPDAVPPAPVKVTSKLGDVWLLGRHRLVCGDCTVPLYVEKALGGAKPNLMVTDPPYGVEYDADWRNRAVMVKGEKRGEHGSRAVGKVQNDDRADWRKAWALFPGAVAYVWHAGTRCGDVAASIVAEGFQLRAQIVWVKQRLVISRGDYHHQHEPCFYGVRDAAEENWHFVPEHEVAAYAVRKGERGDYVGGRKQSTVWFIEHSVSDTGHSTQKPVECMRRPIENNSKAGDAVYEPFSGSGTTIIAGEITGRTVHAIEIDPVYCDVAVLRWQEFTGLTATLEGGGKFEEAA